MTTEQRKISLISWISNLEDESVLSKIEDFRDANLDEYPHEIVDLLKISDALRVKGCIERNNPKDKVEQ
ncbi:hypothetical protein BFP72_02995 [Reichenbachiella sp. 5M10]|uniref:hypothetical protein n=1 Tax=Reichenbachiella sp. 5M10 TaxID=1889772 RepID=UPI000C161E8D|nr:hypothetical protein [Reichenbachiella sp. 5M10]PIB34454.1 hypothetical protein BFP72_02995 [Reichenbachiella sp. 5M10]